jgi:hypothetical protein
MNRRKAEFERRKIINLIRPSNRKANCLVFYPNESENHTYKKFIVFRSLLKKGYELYSECLFINGGRADLVAIKEGKGFIIEILESEKKEGCINKLKQYPRFTGTFMVQDFDDIDKMLCDL